MRRILVLACLLTVLATGMFAQAPDTKVSLVSEQNPARPGSSILLGIHFQIPSGWHMYWINPGDAGQPPRVQWSLPSGWSAGDIEWPTPTRLTNAAGVDYGYEGEVTLLAPVKVGASGGDITANLRWLVCKNVCVPQKGQASIAARVSATPGDSPAKATIVAAEAKLPQTVPSQWKMNAFQNPRQIVLNFRPGIKVQDAVFFPAQGDVIENAAPQKLSSTSYAAQLALKKAENKKAAKLSGVLVVNDKDSYSVDVPVK